MTYLIKDLVKVFSVFSKTCDKKRDEKVYNEKRLLDIISGEDRDVIIIDFLSLAGSLQNF